MKRRHALSLLGTAAVAGCTSAVPFRGTADAAPAEVGARNPDDCPPFDPDVQRVVCAPTTEDADLTLAPAEQSASLPRAEYSFALTNRTSTTFKTNFYGWSVWKYADGKWFRVAPQGWPVPLMRLDPGASHEWDLTVDNSDLDRPIPRAEGTESATVVGLGGGTYAFGIDGWFEGQSYENATGVAAHFDLKGDPLTLTTVGIDRVERDGDAVVLHGYPEDGTYRANYVVTRVETPEEEPRQMVAEQVLRDTPLRNALAHFDSGVRRVRLLFESTTFPPFGIDEPRFVRYDGRDFRIETEWEGDPPE